MKQLVKLRNSVVKNTTNTPVVPAIVDTAAWNTFHLSIGAPFTLTDKDGTVNLIAIARVEHIPTIYDTNEATDTGDTLAAGGILVDYQSYAAAYYTLNTLTLPTTTVWLRTYDDPGSLASVQHALSTGNLSVATFISRRALISDLSTDPLYLAFIGILILAIATAVLLALMGNLVTSWVSVCNRLTNFAILRAIGSSPLQITRILLWEQSITYTVAIALGVLFGNFLAMAALPVLVFTNITIAGVNGDISSGEFYLLQGLPPIQIVIPVALGIALVILIAACIFMLGMTSHIVLKPAMSQALRLNED